MDDIQEVLDRARALGEALAAHPRVKAYHAAQQAVRDDQAARQLLRDYQAHVERICQLEAELKPVEVADKQKLREYESRVAGNPALKNLMRAQADYVDLMNTVNQAMDAPLMNLGRPETPA